MEIRRFNTPFWMRNPHIQTSWGSFFRTPVQFISEKLRVPLRDGLCLLADYKAAAITEETGQEPDYICVFLHGLTGSAASHYIKGMQRKIANFTRNCATLAVNHRGSLGHECPSLESPMLYHAGMELDLVDIIHFIGTRWPDSKILLLGISLSGNMIVRALGLGLIPQVHSAIAISVPFELEASANAVDKGMGKLYRRYLVERMKVILQNKQTHLSAFLSKADLANMHSFWALDNFIVAPIHGFRNVHHYYNEASCRQFIPAIQQPLLIVQSLDDPLVPFSCWPACQSLPKCVDFEAYDCGGHVGFMNLEGYWLEQRVLDWVKEYSN